MYSYDMLAQARLVHAGLTVLISGPLVAAIHTVSNDPNRPAVYSTLSAAHDAAADNDTIFLFGTPSGTMGGGTISKPLYIMGNGYDPAQPSLRSRLGGVTLDPASSGTVLEGLSIVQMAVNGTVTIRNCDVRLDGASVQSLITIGASGQITAYDNILMRNENGTTTGFYTIIGNTNNTLGQYFYNNVIIFNNHNGGGNNCIENLRNAVFSHNVFLSWDANESNLMSGGCQDNVFSDNILYNIFTVSSNCNLCGFMNNLVAGCTDCNMITGNQTGTPPILDTPVFVGGYTGGGWDFASQNLALADGSPGEGGASGGDDIGLYGGPYAMHPGTAHNQTLTIIPYITAFNLVNPVIPQATGGPLQINAGATIINP